MTRQHFFTVSVFLVFILSLSGIVFAQRVIDLDTVWGDMRALGKDAYDMSGRAVSHGDINGDGYNDIIIGACVDIQNSNKSGTVYVIFGSSNPPSTLDLSTESADITVFGAADDDRSGESVGSGDVNGDGYDDIIIGAPNANSPGALYAGMVYVIFGSSSPPPTIDLSTTSADITIGGKDFMDYCGQSVASRDVNGDGFDDIIIGAYGAKPGGRQRAGETYVIFSDSFSSPPYTIYLNTQSPDITVCGAAEADNSGWTVASGDVNGDGYEDIIIGAPHAKPGEFYTYAGETYVIFGCSFAEPPYTIDLSTQSADITVCGDDDDYSASAVASGDVNGDGYEDIIIGALCARPCVSYTIGATYVIFGFSTPWPAKYTIDLSVLPADIAVCSEYGWSIGWMVASGDVNNDGYADIIIDAPLADAPGGTDAGKIFVIYGSGYPPSTVDLYALSADITIYGDDENDNFGRGLASGDINGDRYDDIIVGAPMASGRTGEAYLIAGGGAFITAHGLGGKSWIKQFSLLGRDWGSFKAFGAVNSQGEVHLSIGDVDADSRDEIAAGQGEGAKSWVKFFEVDGSLISTFKAFGAANTNGELHLALGNFDADTADNEIAIAQGEGGQSWVKLFNADGTFMQSLKAFGAGNAQGEVHVAAGDFNEDGIDEIVVGMGEGGSSRVKIFESPWGFLLNSFRAYDAADNPGGEVRLAVGNFDADADMEIAVSTGYNGGNKVRLFEKDGTLIKQFLAFGFGGNTNGDVQIAAADIDNDGIDELICGHGEGGNSAVKVFKPDGTVILNFKAFGGVNAQGQVNLGRSNY